MLNKCNISSTLASPYSVLFIETKRWHIRAVASEFLSLSLMLRGTISGPVCLGIKHPSGAYDQILFPYGIWNTSDSYVLDSVGCPLWLGDGSVFCMCRWSFPAQSFSGPSPLGLATVFYCLIWDFPFRRLLRLAGSRWRYSEFSLWSRFFAYRIGDTLSKGSQCWLAYPLLRELNSSLLARQFPT
jgi:hypothetical protein